MKGGLFSRRNLEILDWREEQGKKVQLKRSSIGRGEIEARPLTVKEAMRDLLEVRAVPVKVKGAVIWLRTEIEGNAAEMFRAGGVQIPKKLLKFCGQEREI